MPYPPPTPSPLILDYAPAPPRFRMLFVALRILGRCAPAVLFTAAFAAFGYLATRAHPAGRMLSLNLPRPPYVATPPNPGKVANLENPNWPFRTARARPMVATATSNLAAG